MKKGQSLKVFSDLLNYELFKRGKRELVDVKQLITIDYIFLFAKNRKRGNEKMKNIEEKILMADEEIKQLQNKRKKLISQQKQEERKKRDKRIYEKGAVFESIFIER